eukprot:482802-Amphidinium_carterae.1
MQCESETLFLNLFAGRCSKKQARRGVGTTIPCCHVSSLLLCEKHSRSLSRHRQLALSQPFTEYDTA